MAVSFIGRVEVFDAKLYAPGGQVNVWVHKLGYRFAANARAAAPIRSGVLKRGIRAGFRKRTTKQIVATIGSTAPHTMWVLRGTKGPIMSDAVWAAGGTVQPWMFEMVNGRPVPKPGFQMAVGRNLGGAPVGAPVTPMFYVSGQRSQNFFYTAWVKTAVRHPSIRGVPFPRGLR
jgi:hypothetical protein